MDQGISITLTAPDPKTVPALSISAASGQEIVRITRDGEVVVNPAFTVDDAALAFWSAVKKYAKEGRG